MSTPSLSFFSTTSRILDFEHCLNKDNEDSQRSTPPFTLDPYETFDPHDQKGVRQRPETDRRQEHISLIDEVKESHNELEFMVQNCSKKELSEQMFHALCLYANENVALNNEV